jgi:GNAT superfamily N-acetyltransferase
MKCRKLKLEELPEVLEILHHENLRYADGTYPEGKWISALMKKGYGYGAYDNKKLKSVLLAEDMICNGIYLWLLSVRPEDIGKGYGQYLYSEFEKKMKKKKKNWIFLTSWDKSESFYNRNGYITTGLIIKEFCKDINN